MIEFDLIEGFDGLDETLNFGTRCLADGSNLHEASTLCVLRSSAQVENPQIDQTFPQINSLIHNEKLFISMGNGLRIFENLNCTSLVFDAKLGEHIDCFCVCKSHLLICLSNGTIQLLDLNIYQIVETKILAENLGNQSKYFIGCFTEFKLLESNAAFLIVNNIGTIYRIFFNCNNSDLDVSIETLKEYKKTINQVALTNNSLLLDGEELLIYDLASCDDMQISGLQLKSVYPCSKNQFIGLTNEGELICICAITSMVHRILSTTNFENFIFNNKKCCVTTVNDESERHVKMLSFPDLNEIYSLKLKGEAQLVHSNNLEDEQMLICKDGSELHIQMINETLPEKRLERLLRKQKFDEAESLATLFNLDMESIRKARAQMFVDKTVCDSDDINHLIEILDTITDFSFKLKCCLNVNCDGFEDVRKILIYGSTLDIKKHQVSNDEDNYYSTINDALYRFDTYAILSRYHKTDFNAIVWGDFCEKNLLKFLYQELKLQNIEVCIILYTRMDNNSLIQITEGDIANILHMLSQMPLNNYMPFLHIFIPKTLLHLPTSLSLILRWIHQRVFDMETKDYANFPENAIYFIDKMRKFLNFEVKQECTGVLERLYITEKAVKTIEIFKNNFKVFVPLDDCLKGPVSLVRALLFLKIEINQNLVDFLIKFLMENRFEADEIFYGVIEEFFDYEEHNWIDILLLIWEGITSTELKLKSILFILKSAKLPWCPQIHVILNKALQFKHALVKELEEEIRWEPVYIVLDNPAYNLKGDELWKEDNDYFAITRIICCNKPTMEEDVFTLCLTEEKKLFATSLILDHYIENSELSKAFRLIQSQNNMELSLKISISLLKKLDSKFPPSNINDYIQVVNYIITRGGLLITETEQNFFNEKIRNFKAFQMIKSNFSLNPTLIDIQKSKDDVINNCFNEIVIRFQDGLIDIKQAMTLCSKLSYLLNIENDDLLVRLCQKINNFEFTANSAVYIYDNSTNTRTMCHMVTFILKSLAAGKIEISKSFDADNDSLEDPEENNEIDLVQLQKCLQYSQKLSTKITTNSEGQHEQDIFNWINRTIYNLSECENTDIFSENLSIDSVNFNAFCDLFLIYIKYIENVRNEHSFLRNSDENSGTEFFEEEHRARIQSVVQNLYTNGKFQTALNAILCIKSVLSYDKQYPDTQHMLSKMINTCNTQLVHKICKAPHIDVDYACHLLCSSNYDRATKKIKDMLAICKRNLKNFQTVAVLGVKVSHHFGITRNVRFYEELILLVNWWNSINNCTIPLKEFFTSTDRKELLKKLIQSHFGLKEVRQFCADFHLKLEPNYMQYLKKLMVNWAPIYRIEKNIQGKRCLIMENDENQLFDDCIKVINLIENKEQVFKFVTNLSESVNIYYYEVFICILNIASSLNMEVITENKNKMCLLKFLKNYKRISQPQQPETEEWFTKFPDTQCIEPLSEFRLLFTSTLFTTNCWNILRYEMNLENYNKWFKMLPILKHLTQDDICTYSIKEVVRTVLMENKVQSGWSLRSKYQDLCDEVNKCAQHISDPERALSALYHVTTNAPQGADQVYAAKLANEYAIKHKNVLPEDKRQGVIKVGKRYLNYSSMHILHQYNLADQKYLQLVGNPDGLINALYNDERIIKQNMDCPDINKAVDEIAELHEINIQEKRISFLEDWLSDKSVSNLDESLYFMSSTSLNNYDDEYTNLKRLSYMCLSGDVTFWRNYLLSKGLVENENVKYPKYHYQAKALKCYCGITPASMVVKESQSSSYQEYLYFIDKLFLLHDLQCLGIHVNQHTLSQCKKELLRKLSKNASNPLNLKIMASICTIFTIYDIKYWELIISNMIKLKLFDGLKIHVNFLRKEPVMYKQFYIDAWQSIIDRCFNYSTNYTREEFDRICIDNMHTIQSCPLLLQINLEPVCSKCIEIRRKDIAAWLLQYLPESKRNILLTNLLDNIDKHVLIKSVKELFNYGLAISVVINFIDEA